MRDPALGQNGKRPEVQGKVQDTRTGGPITPDQKGQGQQSTLAGGPQGDTLLAELDGTNNLLAAYTTGANGLLSQRRNGVSSFYHYDALGSVRQLSNSSQTITDTYSFDAYGNITSQGGSTVNPAKYVGSQGYYGDNDSALMLLGHRYYDPTVGRFITLDPIKDGVNWYGYCGNNPINATDASGLLKLKDVLITILGVGLMAVGFLIINIEGGGCAVVMIGIVFIIVGLAVVFRDEVVRRAQDFFHNAVNKWGLGPLLGPGGPTNPQRPPERG